MYIWTSSWYRRFANICSGDVIELLQWPASSKKSSSVNNHHAIQRKQVTKYEVFVPQGVESKQIVKARKENGNKLNFIWQNLTLIFEAMMWLFLLFEHVLMIKLHSVMTDVTRHFTQRPDCLLSLKCICCLQLVASSTWLHTPSVSQQRVLMQCLGNGPYRITAFCSPLWMWTACDKWANCGSGYSQVRHLLPSWHREPGKRLPTRECASILMGPKSGVASSVWLARVSVKTFISPSGC